MAYVEGRLVYDADSHIHEPPGYAESYADPSVRAELAERLATFRKPPGVEEAIAKQQDPAFRANDAEEILLRKNSLAVGAVIREDRSRALDLLGFAAQLVFTTTYLDPAARVRRQRRGGPGLRDGAGPQPRPSSTSAASTPACCPSATCRSPTSTWPPS